ncbi:Uncharacterized protein FWK35_00029286 [Aphis craccivora]|uniref:Uncharacterized protein n=1 Tax=Aphis craccivora TaxID=307492 RepID=A0A6G0VYM7_APHCR|nr:Uncharacterized protein FWK35_00029286 [Aphis craccivora]
MKLPIFCITSSTKTENVNVDQKRKHKKKRHFKEFFENEEHITTVDHTKKNNLINYSYESDNKSQSMFLMLIDNIPAPSSYSISILLLI